MNQVIHGTPGQVGSSVHRVMGASKSKDYRDSLARQKLEWILFGNFFSVRRYPDAPTSRCPDIPPNLII
jgi:hypothetical protein